MKPKAAWTDRFQYWLDNQFSRGTRSLIKWLGIINTFANYGDETGSFAG